MVTKHYGSMNVPLMFYNQLKSFQPITRDSTNSMSQSEFEVSIIKWRQERENA